jgi:hypothetical protein
MKWILIVGGGLLIAIGALWALQGLGVITQGAMAGHMRWTLIGGILAVAGAVLVVMGFSRRRSTRPI